MKRRPTISSDSNIEYNEMYEFFLQDNFQQANKKGTSIIKKDPTHEKTLLLLGQIALRRKLRSNAREWYNKAFGVSKSQLARLGRADASFGKKNYEAALEDYLDEYEQSRKTFPSLVKLAHTYAALELHKIALRYYKQAVVTTPQDMDARFSLTRHLIKLRHYKEAEQEIKTTKDRYYHHKSSYLPSVFDEIIRLEQQLHKYLHRRSQA